MKRKIKSFIYHFFIVFFILFIIFGCNKSQKQQNHKKFKSLESVTIKYHNKIPKINEAQEKLDMLHSETMVLEILSPPKINYIELPEYSFFSKIIGLKGQVSLKCSVNKKGYVTKVEILRSSGHKTFDRKAMEAAYFCNFTPPKKGLDRIKNFEILITYIFAKRKVYYDIKWLTTIFEKESCMGPSEMRIKFTDTISAKMYNEKNIKILIKNNIIYVENKRFIIEESQGIKDLSDKFIQLKIKYDYDWFPYIIIGKNHNPRIIKAVIAALRNSFSLRYYLFWEI